MADMINVTFRLDKDIYDPFYNEINQAELNRRINEIESGTAKFVVKTMDELEAMEND